MRSACAATPRPADPPVQGLLAFFSPDRNHLPQNLFEQPGGRGTAGGRFWYPHVLNPKLNASEHASNDCAVTCRCYRNMSITFDAKTLWIKTDFVDSTRASD